MIFRTAAAESLPLLLECAKIRGPAYLQEMWGFILPDLLKVLHYLLIILVTNPISVYCKQCFRSKISVNT